MIDLALAKTLLRKSKTNKELTLLDPGAYVLTRDSLCRYLVLASGLSKLSGTKGSRQSQHANRERINASPHLELYFYS